MKIWIKMNGRQIGITPPTDMYIPVLGLVVGFCVLKGLIYFGLSDNYSLICAAITFVLFTLIGTIIGRRQFVNQLKQDGYEILSPEFREF